MNDANLIHPSVGRFHGLIDRYGTAEERERGRKAADEMLEMLNVFPGSRVLRLEEMTLPSILIARAENVARRRHVRVARFALSNKMGFTRTFEDELRSVEGEFAACIFCDLPFNHEITPQAARARGNLGHGVSAHVARPGNYSLVVNEKEPAARRMVSILTVAEHTYRFAGWIRAGHAQQPAYQRHFNRNGVESNPYFVPVSQLHPPQTWAS